jgi:hypothetical protein
MGDDVRHGGSHAEARTAVNLALEDALVMVQFGVEGRFSLTFQALVVLSQGPLDAELPFDSALAVGHSNSRPSS